MDEVEKSHVSADAEAMGQTFSATSSLPSPSIRVPQRLRLRQQKLRLTFIGYVVVLVMFSVLQILAVWFFALGFLLSRQVLPDIAECTASLVAAIDDSCMPPQFEKVVILVIDALRFDFTIPVEDQEKAGTPSEEYFHNNFPILHETFVSQPQNAIHLKFMADPPTTTLQRLKGLTTGTLPTFIDAGSNFDGDSVDEDNWLLQLHRHNKSVAFMGDDTWKAMFSKYIDPTMNFPYDSLNVRDLHTVDNGVLEHLWPLLSDKASAQKWDVLIGHFLGVDHVGHRFGPNHHAMKEKLNQMNEVIKQAMKALDNKTLLLVMGDHGMDSTGNHGGEALDELESTFFMYLKRKFVHQKDKSHYDTKEKGKHFRSINQIDLVPTLSLLLGLPIPHNNLGFPVDEVFGDKELAIGAYKTLHQIQNFRSQMPSLSHNEKLDEDFERLSSDFQDQVSSFTTKKTLAALVQRTKEYQFASLEECKALWARFDLVSIGIGLLILILSLSFIMTYSRSIPAVRVLTMSFEFIGSVVAMLMLGLVSSFSVYVVLRPLKLKLCLAVGLAIGIVVGLWAPIMDRFSVLWLVHQIFDFFVYNFSFWSFLGILFAILHFLLFASNSFVIWEDKVILFFIATFGWCSIIYCLRLPGRVDRVLGSTHAVTFVIISRIVGTINLCREEQAAYCVPTFLQGQTFGVGLLYVVAFLLPLVTKQFYNLTNSYHSAGKVWISTTSILLGVNAVYWTLEFITSHNLSFLNYPLNLDIFNSIRLGISRIVLFVTLVLANYSWSRGPLCVKLDVDNTVPEQPKTVILGYENIYGSSYFLLILNFTIAIMLVTKPLGAVSLCMLIIQILSLLELSRILDIRKNLITPVILTLLGFQHFFATGHQATIPSVQWDVGFVTTETIIFPFTHLNIFLNTFGPFLITCLSVPLISLWAIPPSNKPITLLSYIVTNITTVITYQSLIALSSFIFAAHFRRHLMVWKIFAPRFMLGGLTLIVTNLTLVVGTLWFGSGKVLTQVNRIFGK